MNHSFAKTRKVIVSCRNPAQLAVADVYLNYFKMLFAGEAPAIKRLQNIMQLKRIDLQMKSELNS